MLSSDPQQNWKAQGLRRPFATFIMLAAVLLIAVSFGAMIWFGSVGVPVGLFVVIIAVALRSLWVSYPHDVLGFCNAVTLTRAAMVATLAGAIFVSDIDGWIVFLIASVAFAMDGLDGWLARRSGLSSNFGAQFDMEVDALLGAVLALVLLAGGRVGLEILVLGFMRYAFVAISFIVPELKGNLPESFRRKTICVVQIAALIILLCPLTPVALMLSISISAALLLVWSFAIDIRWLMRVPE